MTFLGTIVTVILQVLLPYETTSCFSPGAEESKPETIFSSTGKIAVLPLEYVTSILRSLTLNDSPTTYSVLCKVDSICNE